MRSRRARSSPRTRLDNDRSDRSTVYHAAPEALAQEARSVDLPNPAPATTHVNRRVMLSPSKASSAGRETTGARTSGGCTFVASDDGADVERPPDCCVRLDPCGTFAVTSTRFLRKPLKCGSARNANAQGERGRRALRPHRPRGVPGQAADPEPTPPRACAPRLRRPLQPPQAASLPEPHTSRSETAQLHVMRPSANGVERRTLLGGLIREYSLAS